MTNLDVNTPLGQKTVEDEKAAAAIFEENNSGIWYIHTDKARAAGVDAQLLRPRDRQLRGMVMTSCRYNFTLEQFWEDYAGEWLVSNHKLIKGRQAAEMFETKFFGFLYVVPEETLLVQLLWTPGRADWSVAFEVRATETQATVNGGRAIRENAYIPMHTAWIFRRKA